MSFRILVGLFVVSSTLASPLQLNVRQNSSTPCAQVSASVAAQSSVATPTVPAQLAYDCITSVPLNKSAALSLIDTITPYFKWQSNTVWLKDPPAEYAEKVQPGIDVWGGLEEIQSKVESEEFENEFDFAFALYTLLQQTHDGHFVFVPDAVGGIFNWARRVPLVSVSKDGKSLPKPFVYPDILAASLGNSSFTPSAITTINGKKAEEYLEDWAQYGSLQDRDALFNNVFYNLASVSIGSASTSIGTFAGSGRGRWIYPGAETELKFENGTTIILQNFARVLVDFKGVTDGKSLYQKYFTSPKPTETEPGPTPSNSSIPTSSSTPTAKPTPAPGYPPPVIRESHNLIGGYYLEDDYSDVAVLSVPSFVSLEEAEIPFQQTGEKFLAAARAAGKKKLIIDVSANGGGTILQGYDLYKQLFPKGLGHAAGDRFRAHEAVDLIGQVFSKTSEGLSRDLVSPDDNETLWTLQNNVVSSVLNYRTDIDEDDKNFDSWADKYGPVTINGDNFTNAFHWNLSDSLTPLNSGGIWVHGYRNLTNFTQPFPAEDIVVVTDGYCASTCTIFSELMRNRAGVKYISLGGRAKEGITQAIGGVKGTNNYPWGSIQALAQGSINNLTSPSEGAKLNKTELGDYWSEVPFDRAAPGTSINVNFRDGWRDEDLGAVDFPLQFLWEPSDCRILYTAEMTYDASAIWKAVADSAWGGYGDNKCIAGSLGGEQGKKEKRELTMEDKALSKRMQAWKRSMSVTDYPMDLYTDLTKVKFSGRGWMAP